MWGIEFRFLPPMAGRCPICAGAHEKGDAHDVASVIYRVRFYRRHGRYPTEADAALEGWK